MDISFHTLEDLSCNLDGADNSAKAGCEEDNISGGLSGFRGSFYRNTTIRLLERRRVVNTVTCHGCKMSSLLYHFDDLVFMFGEDFSETISSLYEIMLSCAAKTTVDQSVGVVDFSTQSQHLAGFFGNSDSITCKHLHLKTKELSLSDGLSGIFTGRIEHGQHSE